MDSRHDTPVHDVFVTTRWTVVLSAGRKSSAQSDRALGELCQTYWYPLYAYVRRQGRTKEDAEELVPGLFAPVLEKKLPRRAQRRTWKIPRLPACLAQAFSRQRMG